MEKYYEMKHKNTNMVATVNKNAYDILIKSPSWEAIRESKIDSSKQKDKF